MKRQALKLSTIALLGCFPLSAMAQDMPSDAFFAALDRDDMATAGAIVEPQLAACVDRNGGASAPLADMADCYALYMFAAQAIAATGEIDKALAYADRSAAIVAASWPDDNYIMASVRLTKSVVMTNANRLDEAVVESRAALRLAESSMAADDPDLANYFGGLAQLYVSLRRYQEAIPPLEKALAIVPDPATRAYLRRGLATAYAATGRYDDAVREYVAARTELVSVLGEQNVGVYDIDVLLAGLYANLGRNEEAEQLIGRAIEYYHQAEAGPDKLAGAIFTYAQIQENLGETEKAREAYATSRTLHIAVFGENHAVIAIIDERLAGLDNGEPVRQARLKPEDPGEEFWAANTAGDFQTALAIITPKLDDCVRRTGAQPGDFAALGPCQTLFLMSGSVAGQLGLYDRAERHSDFAVKIAEAVYQDDRVALAMSYVARGSVLGTMGQHKNAITPLRQALGILEREVPPGSPYLLGPLRLLSSSLSQIGNIDEALTTIERAVAIAKTPDDRESLWATHARVLMAAGEIKKAEQVLLQGLEEVNGLRGPTHIRSFTIREALAGVYVKQSRTDEAIAMLKPLVKETRKLFGEKAITSMMVNALGEAYLIAGLLREAESAFRESLAFRLQSDRIDPSLVLLAYNNLGLVLMESGKLKEAMSMYREAMSLTDKSDSLNPSTFALVMTNIARLSTLVGANESAVDLNRLALKVVRDKLGARHPSIAQLRANLGQALTAVGKFEEARTELEAGYELADQLGTEGRQYKAGAAFSRAVLADEREAVAVARDWYRRAESAGTDALPEDHPLRISQRLFWGKFELTKGARTAVSRTLLRRAGDGLLSRVASYRDFDAQAQNEMRTFGVIFRRQIAAAWQLGEAGDGG